MSKFDKIVKALSNLPAAKLSGYAPMTAEEYAQWCDGFRQGVEEGNRHFKSALDRFKDRA